MTFHDARLLDDGTVLETDLCVVGAGAAGITIADAFVGGPHRVLLLESGDRERSDINQQLYRGEHIGIHYPPLEQTRLRYFGGSTNHWAGWCRPPLASDFAARYWVPNSGWPLSHAELSPYLPMAQSICDLEPRGFDAADWITDDSPPIALDEERFTTQLIRFSPPTRFASRFGDRLGSSDNVDVYLNANLLSIESGRNGASVSRLHCGTLDGGRFMVRPRLVVLATGGIENARILLASTGAAGTGVGNERDLVGRFFMDHFKYRVGILDAEPGVSLGFYQRDTRMGSELKAVVGFAESVLEAERMTPAHFEFNPLVDEAGGNRYRVELRIDPAPNRDSRIKLDRVKDRLGVPRVLIDLRYTEMEAHTYGAAVRLLRDGVARSGLGMLHLQGDGADASLQQAPVTATGFHHMGATRMSETPATGVVDRDCRVHSSENLFVAGCSVFCGYEGYPTMTLVALACRLVDHLGARLS